VSRENLASMPGNEWSGTSRASCKGSCAVVYGDSQIAAMLRVGGNLLPEEVGDV
jgi:hypothetical protein